MQISDFDPSKVASSTDGGCFAVVNAQTCVMLDREEYETAKGIVDVWVVYEWEAVEGYYLFMPDDTVFEKTAKSKTARAYTEPGEALQDYLSVVTRGAFDQVTRSV
jgi:gentisate 1,2-dioxygenase